MKHKAETREAGRRSDKSSVARLRLTPGQLRVLEGLEKGRRRAIERAKLRAAFNAKRVMAEAIKDLNAGNPKRGRAKRIAVDLPPDPFDGRGRRLTERAVNKILARLSVVPIRSAQNSTNYKEVGPW